MIQVYKFGGASVKDATAIKNMARIVEQSMPRKLVIIVSAMDKTTNWLEKVLDHYTNNRKWVHIIDSIERFHLEIAGELFDDKHEIFNTIHYRIDELKSYLRANHNYKKTRLYSHIVSYGELLSTEIIAAYLDKIKIRTTWIDARKIVSTDDNFIDSHVDWQATGVNVKENVIPCLKTSTVVTQGFIGANREGMTTTLGREGSDFSGAVVATCLSAESLTVWKDVPGILTADPKLESNTEKIPILSYKEASEMTFYGAKVIHPKTIRPLATQNITLYVKPFHYPNAQGTVIREEGPENYPPIFIEKNNQTLISFKIEDLSFIDERKMSIIFGALHDLNIKVNLMENSAVSFSICIDTKFDKVERLIGRLSSQFKISYNQNLTLHTIKNYDENALDSLDRNQNILLEQKSRNTIHLLYQGI